MGNLVGDCVGENDGANVGTWDGGKVGASVGDIDGANVGL